MRHIHAVPGRLRVRSEALRRNPDCAMPLKVMLESMRGVRSVELRPVTGSIMVSYSARELTGDTIFETLSEWGFITDPTR